MELVTPGIGLIFWTTLVFLTLVFLLAKFAWKPILSSVNEREQKIEDALLLAEKTKLEMQKIQSDNQALLREARDERDKILKEAKEAKDAIVGEAKNIASKEGQKILENARLAIQNEKMAAITELKNQVATLSLDIAEKILKNELSSNEKQKAYVDHLLEDVNLN